MNKGQRRVLERTLTALLLLQLVREDAKFSSHTGVCWATAQLAVSPDEQWGDDPQVQRVEVDGVLEEAFPRWQHFSGSTTYPVPSGEGRSVASAFVDEPLWEGHGLTMRTDLIAFLIADIERRLA